MYGNVPFSITTFQEVPFLAPIFALKTQFIRKIKLDFFNVTHQTYILYEGVI